MKLNEKDNTLKSFLNQPGYHALEELLEKRLESARNTLKSSSELHEVYRAQGEVRSLESLLKVKSSLNGK